MRNVPSLARQHVTTLICALVTVALSLVSDFLLGLPKETTWLTFFLGATVTVAATLLETRLSGVYSDLLNSKLRINSLIEQIEDPDLRVLANTSIDRCVLEIEGYRRGFIPASVHHHQRDQILKAKISYTSIIWMLNSEEFIEHSESATWRSYYDVVSQVAKRGVAVEQVFVTAKKNVFDAKGAITASAILDYLKKCAADGILVRVAFIEEWKRQSEPSDLYQSFSVIDNGLVIASVSGIDNIRLGTLLTRQPNRVQEYLGIYRRFQQLSRPLNEFLGELGSISK